jgi:hypothetical protein
VVSGSELKMWLVVVLALLELLAVKN